VGLDYRAAVASFGILGHSFQGPPHSATLSHPVHEQHQEPRQQHKQAKCEQGGGHKLKGLHVRMLAESGLRSARNSAQESQKEQSNQEGAARNSAVTGKDVAKLAGRAQAKTDPLCSNITNKVQNF
jgi:hypothetical protein